MVTVVNLNTSGKKKYLLKNLLEILLKLPWRQTLPFEGWEEKQKISQEIKPRTLFQEFCVFVLIALSWGCQWK